MNLENTKPQDVSTGVLIGKLREGWTAAHGGWAQELAQRWAAKTGAHTERTPSGSPAPLDVKR